MPLRVRARGVGAVVESRLGSLDPLSRDDRMIQRHFFAGASDFEPDKQGGS